MNYYNELTMPNKNILEICLSPDAGGLELYMMKLSEYLHQKISLISVINKSGKLQKYYEQKSLPYVALEKRSTLLSFVSARELAKIIDANKIDVLHLHWTKDLLVCVLAKLFSKRKPKIVQSRHMTMTRFKNDFYHRFIYKNITMMIAVTKQVQGQIEQYIPQDIRPKVETIYIGTQQVQQISVKEKQKLREKYHLGDSFVVGIFGRVEEGKGQYLLIEALEYLKQEGHKVKVLIVGHAMSDEYLASLKKEILLKGMQEYVIFTGFTSEVQELMQVCDTVVLATKKETFGLVLIEAMAAKVAVIASDTGGPLEIIEEGVSGLLFKTGDSVALASKIKLLLDADLRESIAKKGQERVEKLFQSTRQYNALLNRLESL